MNPSHDDTLLVNPNAPLWAKRLLLVLALLPRLLAIPVLIIYFPVLVGAGMLVCITSAGPAFVKKAYIRHNGSLVYLYELRTECWRTWEKTPVGAFLHAADLHRLPRLVNVLQGQVGVGERVRRLS